MTTFERVKLLADKQKLSIVELEERLGFSRNSLYAWKRNNPSSDKLQKVADYFNVSTDYLLGRTEKQHYYDLSKKDELDIAKEAERMLAGLETNSEVNYYGEPLDDEDRDKLRDALELALTLTRVKAKKKFTPKKFRDEESDNK